jgi:hypothetical protein
LDDESRPCLPEKAEIQLMRNWCHISLAWG